MLVITVMYPQDAGMTFDQDYYTRTHLSMVDKLWSSLGLEKTTVLKGVTGPDGAAPHFLITAILQFSSMNAFAAAAEAHGREIFADIPNFTNGKPIIQFNEIV